MAIVRLGFFWVAMSTLISMTRAARATDTPFYANRGPRGAKRNRHNAVEPQKEHPQQQRLLKSEKKAKKSDKKAKKSMKSNKGPKNRDCKVKEKSNKVEFKCKTASKDSTGIQDEIKFKVDMKSVLAVDVEYREKVPTDENTETDTKTKYEIVFDRVIEYSKPNNRTTSGRAYEWEKDTILQEKSLIRWQDFSGISDQSDGVVSTFKAISLDQTVMFKFTVARSVEGSMSPNSMKIDFELQNFPWKRTDSYVALLTTITSERNVKVREMEYMTENTVEASDVAIDFVDAVNTAGFLPIGAFTWAEIAQASNSDGSSTVDVIATFPPTTTTTERRLKKKSKGTVEQIAFSFVGDNAQGASDIYWDPEAGINYNSAGVRIGGAALGAIVCLVTVLLSK